MSKSAIVTGGGTGVGRAVRYAWRRRDGRSPSSAEA